MKEVGVGEGTGRGIGGYNSFSFFMYLLGAYGAFLLLCSFFLPLQYLDGAEVDRELVLSKGTCTYACLIA